MISAKELKELEFAVSQSGYSTQEVDFVLEAVIDTINAYEKQSDELYKKLDTLASQVEEYRQEENAIKTALVRAEKLAETVEEEAKEKAAKLTDETNASAKAVMDEATDKAAKVTADADEYAKNLIDQKNKEAEEIIVSAQTKANEAINSAKIVAADILDQAKTISEDLISKSKAEKEAYEILIGAIKSDAKEFIENVKDMYKVQLEALENANLDVKSDESINANDKVEEINDDVTSLVDEIEEVSNAFPEVEPVEAPAPVEEAPEPEEEEIVIEQPAEEPVKEEKVEETEEKDFVPVFDEAEEEEQPEPIDPMDAVAAFSTDEITPIDTKKAVLEINEEVQLEDGSLFDEQNKKPDFENYFEVSHKDVHGDKSEVISLLPPDEEDDDAPLFRGFFKKKK